MKKEKRLITSALPYTNQVPHLGNIVGSHLPADIFSRYCRLMNYDILLIGGTDENGTTTEIAAQKAKVTPRELVDFFYEIHKEVYNWFNISYDNFSRTSREIHHELSQKMFLTAYKNGYISEKIIKIPFCNECNRSLADRYIMGVCPYCKYENAKGDQCEKCSRLLEVNELKSLKCSVCNHENIVFKEKKHLFLDLDKLSNEIREYIGDNKNLRVQVRSIALAWIKEGLRPRDITRDISWGIKVPMRGYEDSVIYSWYEAPIGYISSTKEYTKKWKRYWQNKNTKIYHFLGKDNIPFHTIFFEAILISSSTKNERFNLPYNVVGLQYLNYEGSKFSKSRGHGVFCENLVNAGLDVDYWRFYLTFLIPETNDTDFVWKDFQERINKELIGNFGNFINRNLSFVYDKFNGNIPKVKINDKKFVNEINKKIRDITDLYEKIELRQALSNILKLSDLGNQYFQKKQPWKNKDKETIFICSNLCKDLALLIQPFIPDSSKKILTILNCNEKNFNNLGKFKLYGKINKPHLLFNKLEDKKLEDLKIKSSKVTTFFKE